MKISYNWLKEYVDHPLSAKELGERLTMSGLELEDTETHGAALDGVVVGQVQDVRQHPNADRLTLCQVDLGEGEPVQIVCGAPNVAAGQKVPVATVGTTLMLPSRDDPSQKVPVKLKKAKLRGEVSFGMICAEDELGLSDDHAGIMVLDEDAAPGQPFEHYLKAHGIAPTDTVLDLAITPNRPDATSHLGVARDVAALTDVPLTRPDVELPEAGGAAAERVTVEIACPEACPRYVALLVRDVEIKESPAWLKQRLTAIGLRPRNNVVDITNYVMHECGQPLHAFDFDALNGQKIIVRQAEGGEAFTTLDGKDHELPAGTVMICDAERFVAIGGIMGGENSEVTEATTNVLVESAYFDPSVTRRSAKALGIASDASYRFERGVDADGQVWAAARAAQLMVLLAGGTLVPGLVDARPLVPTPRVLELRMARLGQILGMEVPQAEAARILAALGFAVEEATEDLLRCTVPTFRPDVEREIDLIEEVARIIGYAAIPEPTHTRLPSFLPRPRPIDLIRRRVATHLQGRGYREVYTNSLLRRDEAERFNTPVLGSRGAVVGTLNPISQEMTTLRPSLLPGALQVMAFNQNHGQDVLRFFEVGTVFNQTDDAGTIVPGYTEHTALLLVAAGPNDAPTWSDDKPGETNFFDVKGAVLDLLDALRLDDVAMTPHDDGTATTAYHLEVSAEGTRLGVIARLADDLADHYDLKAPAYFAELDYTALVALATPRLTRFYQPVSRYPMVERDLAVVVGRAEPVGPMQAAIREAGQPLLRKVDVFDLFEDERLGSGKKSVAFALRFGAERTLTDAEVEARIEAILRRLEADHNALLRQ